jgi:outer membrane protein assembly factor BamA
MTHDTWHNRDLPVLKAAVGLYEEKGRGPRVSAIEARTGFDQETVQRALRALYSEPYFEEVRTASGVGFIVVGRPTSAALRVAGQWPTPEAQLERMVAALEAASDDDARPERDRSRFKQAALWLGGAASQVAIGALRGAGGNVMTGG